MSEIIKHAVGNPVENQSSPMFTAEQQEFINQLVQGRISDVQKKAGEDLAAVQAEARQRVAEARGIAIESADYLTLEKVKAAKAAERREDLGAFFGKNSDSKKANDLAMKNKPLYDALRKEAAELGLVASHRPQGAVRNRLFNPTQ